MTIIGLIILLVIVGILLWAINAYVPMDPKIKQILNIVVVLFMAVIAIVFLLGLLGIDTGLRSPALQ